jgi:hypothetical protein
MIATLKKRKSKSSQYRFLQQHQQELRYWLDLQSLPVRSTYCRRYQAAHRLFEQAIVLQGRKALAEHVTSADTAAVDKSLIAARGPKGPPQKPRYRYYDKPGLDRQAAWSYSPHDGWVWGYSYEVVVSATAGWVVMPLAASAQRANVSEHKSFGPKIRHLPRSTHHLLADSGYDDNRLGEQIEYTSAGRHRRRHFICPPQSRGGKPAVGRCRHRGTRELGRQHRIARFKFYQSRRGRCLFGQRRKTIEPFNQWFKQLFELEDRVWHRGLANNQTQLLAAMFCYQLLVRYAHRSGRRDGQIQWILDAL